MDFGLLVLGVGFLVVSTVGFYVGTMEFRDGKRSEEWPCVEGIVEESSVQFDHDGYPVPKIRYKYFIDGIPRRCDRIGYEARNLDQQTADAFVEKYSIGRKVTVYYDPNNVEKAVLEPGVSQGTIIFAFLFLFAFHIVGWSMLYFALVS